MRLLIIVTFVILRPELWSLLQAQQQTSPPKAKLVAVGEISTLDVRHKSFEVKSIRETNDSRGDFSSGIRIQIGQPDPRSRPGALERPPDELQQRPPREAIRTTVFMTDATVCKDDGKVAACSSLKVTDRVRVTGNEKWEARGHGLYATEVVRTTF